jgi:hypothetical protein
MRIVSASLIILTACGAFGQSATAPIAFEVASVKPNKSGSNGSSEKERNGRLTAVNISLSERLHQIRLQAQRLSDRRA